MSAELLAIGAVGVVLGLALGFAITRQVTLERIREIVGGRRDQPLEEAVRELHEHLASAERRARLETEDLAYVTGMVGTGILRLDDELCVVAANRAAHVLLDAAPGTLVGRSIPDRPASGGGSAPARGLGDVRLDAIVRTAWRNGSAADEFLVGGPDGRVMSVRGRRSPSEGTWLVLEDLSELRRLQRIRSEFVDNLSHELRTPLTTVRLLTETLLRDLEDTPVPARVVDIVQKIDVETGHLVQMATELLDLAKIEQGGGVQLYVDDVNLRAVIEGVIDRLRLFADRQGVDLRADVDPSLPNVLGDQERLGQLLVNLVHNAIKFSPSGGPVTVHARGTRDDKPAPLGALPDVDRADSAMAGEAVAPPAAPVVLLEVEDHGIGIPAADVPRVFERFYKVDKARVRGQGGTGLGLAIARHIAEDHGGRISVRSVEGQGSTFRVTLPAAPPVPPGPDGRSA